MTPLCPACTGSLQARDEQRDKLATLRAITQALQAMGAHYVARTEAAEQEADLARATAQARELELLLLALRHDVAIPPLASPGLEKVRRLWQASATYHPTLTRRERWDLLVGVYPPARLLAPKQAVTAEAVAD